MFLTTTTVRLLRSLYAFKMYEVPPTNLSVNSSGRVWEWFITTIRQVRKLAICARYCGGIPSVDQKK